jgi:methylenetetrahydrofolate dehydrogenase (NADP+) / methenyltetrahydrofolate cyclohydrolase
VSAARIDGQEISARVKRAVAAAVRALPAPPCLAVVLVGEDAASEVYVRNKIKASGEAGILSRHHRLPAAASQVDVESVIAGLNADPSVDGILLQLPLPSGLDADAAIERIDPAKDVDGLTEASAGRLALGKPGLRPCTPSGCVIMAKAALGGDLSGLHVVVIGRSILVGKPAAQLFLAENCTVTIAHSRTRDLAALCQTADILVPAAGRPAMVRGDWVKPGAAVIDVGINRVPAPEKGEGKTKLVGDAHFESCAAVAGHITPVPGGVGLMTVACLLRNTVLAACARRGWALPTGL